MNLKSLLTMIVLFAFLVVSCDSKGDSNMSDILTFEVPQGATLKDMPQNERESFSSALGAGKSVKLLVDGNQMVVSKQGELVSVLSGGNQLYGKKDAEGEIRFSKTMPSSNQSIEKTSHEVLNEFSYKLMSLMIWAIEFTFEVLELENEHPNYTEVIFEISPDSVNLPAAGLTFNISIWVNNVDNLAGWDMELKYDPSVIQIAAAGDVVMEETFIESGGRSATEGLKNIDNVGGVLEYGVFTMPPGSGADGTGKLATITFTVQAGRAASNITFQDSNLSDPAGDPINIYRSYQCNLTAD